MTARSFDDACTRLSLLAQARRNLWPFRVEVSGYEPLLWIDSRWRMHERRLDGLVLW